MRRERSSRWAVGRMLGLLAGALAWGATDLRGQTGELFPVSNEPLSESLTALEIAATEDGSFRVLWEVGGDLRTRRFTESGHPQSDKVRVDFGQPFGDPRLIYRGNGLFQVVARLTTPAGPGPILMIKDLEKPKDPEEPNQGSTDILNVAPRRILAFDATAPPSGGLAVAWIEEDGQGTTTLRGVLDAGRERPFKIPSASIDEQASPRIVVTPDDSLVVTWEAGSAENRNLFVGVFDPVGNLLFSNRDSPVHVLVNILTKGSQSQPDLVILSSPVSEQDLPTFLLVWESDPLLPPALSTGSGIFARRFESGEGGPEIQVNSRIAGNQLDPQIAVGTDRHVLVVWEDEERHRISAQALDSQGFPFGPSWDVDPGDGEASRPRIAALPDGRFVAVWQRRRTDEMGDDAFDILGRIVDPPATLPCIPGATTLCLQGGRYQVQVATPDGSAASAQRTGIESGYFWILEPDNVELWVSVVRDRDGDAAVLRAVGLSILGLALTVTDTWTGRTVRYASPPGSFFPPLRDDDSFRLRGLQPRRLDENPDTPSHGQGISRIHGGSEARSSPQGQDALSLVEGRFRVQLRQIGGDGAGETEAARAFPTTSLAGTFSLAGTLLANTLLADTVSPSEVDGGQALDAAVKILDRCDFDGHHWLFVAGLTDEAVELTVRDTVTGTVVTVRDPEGLALPPRVRTRLLPCS